ncbi:motilin receptor [Hemicordylus capensis]|uniref:motilin receptor n=1 Tax=Hemicordylus capensis TaxID=884348 RepID=UPI0023046209|nr:motilin receptor [Hemicordylus capensis]XP_053159727.1 motilin receptor [Hemicordylus capensis]XP_053159798.1 motilin receptor [Hemicordylus capensis]
MLFLWKFCNSSTSVGCIAVFSMGCANISSPQQDIETWALPPCNKYLCPLLPMRALIPVTVVCSALLLLGVAGNILTVVVTGCSRSLRNTTSLYLGSLAVADLLLLILGLPLDLYRLWRSRPWVLGTMLCRVWHWSGEACAYCSILHLTALTVERYLAICFPLRAKVLVTRRRVKVLLVVLWTVALLSAAPFFFLVNVQPADNTSSDDDFSHECGPTVHAKESGLLGTMLLVTTSYFVLPCLCLYLLYGLIARELLYGNKTHLGVASYQGHQQTVRMLVVLVLAFVICWLPFHIGRIIYINAWSSRMMHFSQYFNVFALQLFYLSACINPILYNLISKKYRAAAYKLLVTHRSGERASTMTRNTTSYRETSASINN